MELDGRRRDGARDAAWAALEQAVIGKAVDLLSGPGGLASFLRRRQLGARLAGPSLPLDIGYAETVPAGIRNAVMLLTIFLKICRFSPRSIASIEAPISSTPYFSRTPAASSAIAVLSAVWPPSVASSASGPLLLDHLLDELGVIGSM